MDGHVYLNMRSYLGKNRRAIASSADGGLTWTSPTLDETLIEPVCQASVLRLSDQVARRLRGGRVRGGRVTVKIRFADMKTITRQCTLEEVTDHEEVIYHAARELLDAHAGGGEVRLIGVSVSALAPSPAPPQTVIFDEDRKREEAVHTVDGIRDRYGDDAITRAAVLAVRPSPRPSG